MVLCKCNTDNPSEAKYCSACYQQLPVTSSNMNKTKTDIDKPTKKPSCLKCKQLWVGASIAIITFIGLANLLFSFITIEWYFMIDIIRYTIILVLGGIGLIVGIYCMKEFCKDPDSEYQGDRLLALCIGLGSLIFLGILIMVTIVLIGTSITFYSEIIPLESKDEQSKFINSQSCDDIIHMLKSGWGSDIYFDYNWYQLSVNNSLDDKCNPWR